MSARIQPANLADLPTVLDSAQVANVLRVSVATVRRLTREGKLRRLAYSTSRSLYSAAEVEAFLSEQTGADS